MKWDLTTRYYTKLQTDFIVNWINNDISWINNNLNNYVLKFDYVNDLALIYLKWEVYNKTEIDNLLINVWGGWPIDLSNYYSKNDFNINNYLQAWTYLMFISNDFMQLWNSYTTTLNDIWQLKWFFSNFSWYDITQTKLKNDLLNFDISGYYTKLEIDSMMATIQNGGTPIDLSNYMTYTNFSNFLDNSFMPISNSFNIDLNTMTWTLINYYTKSQIDSKLTDYVLISSMTQYYDKTAIDNIKLNLESQISNIWTPDLTNYYTKPEVDN